jgi:hypothetical protein
MNRKKAIIVLCCVTFCLLGAAPVSGQGARTDLKEKRITITMEAQPLGEVFRYLMVNYDIPIGFEESVLDRGRPDFAFQPNLPAKAQHRAESPDGYLKLNITAQREFQPGVHPITLYIEDGSVEEVFDEIVRQMENYKWEINDGVVNIFPVKGRDPRFERLLSLRVNSFTFEKGKTVQGLTTNIMSLPEFMQENKLHFNGQRLGTNFVIRAQYGRVIDEGMDFSNLTFRDLLNRITKVKRGGWRLKWKWISKTTGEEHIDIDI